MQTQIVRVDPVSGPWPEVEELGKLVREGGLVAFPTETVYGIAVNLRDEAACRRLYQAKGRPPDKPLTVHLPGPDAVHRFVRTLPLPARKLIDRFWPGPLTIVLTDRHGRPTGFRVPDLPVAQALLSAADCRVGAPSANPSGAPPADSVESVLEHFDGILDAVIDAGPCRHGAASSVVRVLPEGDMEMLREGVIPETELREATAKLLLFICSGNRCRSPLAAAIATRLLARRLGVEDYELLGAGYRVESAGTACLHGERATGEMESEARSRGLDITDHRSRPLTLSLLEEADEIFVMTKAQGESILEFSPDAVERMRPLDRKGYDVEDPYGEGLDAYAATAERIHRAIQERLDDF